MANKTTVGELVYKIEGDMKDLRLELKKSETEVGKLKESLEKNDKAVGTSVRGFDVLKKALAGLGIGIVLRQLFNFTKQLSSAFGDASSNIIKLTGASGQALEDLQNSANAVARRVPQSLEEVSLAIGEVNTRLELTGATLEKTTRQLLDFARITGGDTTSTVVTVSRLINALGLEADQTSNLLDKLTFASQASGINAQRLVQLITEAGPAFQELGFDLDRSIALFSQFEKFGARPEEVVSSLNLALNRMAKEGFTDAKVAFETLLNQIKEAPDILTATLLASELFGSRVGGKIAEDIRAGRFELDDFVASLQNVDGALKNTAQESLTNNEAFKILGNQLKQEFEPSIRLINQGLNRLVRNLTSVKNITLDYVEEQQILLDSYFEYTDKLEKAIELGDEEAVSFNSRKLEAIQLRRQLAFLTTQEELLEKATNGTKSEQRQAELQLIELQEQVDGTFRAYDRLLNLFSRLPGSIGRLSREKQKLRREANENFAKVLETDVDELRKTIEETEEGLENLGNSLEKEVGTSASKTSQEIEKAQQELEKFQNQMLSFIDNARKTKQSLENDLEKSFESFGKSLVDNLSETNQNLASLVINAEDTIDDLRQQLRTELDFDRRDELRTQIKEQEDILKARADFEERQANRIEAIREKLESAGIDTSKAGFENILSVRNLEEEIEEQRRLANLDEFTRFEEQQAKKLALLTDSFISEVTVLNQKIDRQKEFEEELTTFLISEDAKRLQNTEQWAEKTIAEYEEVAKSLETLLSTQTRLRNLESSIVPNIIPSSIAQQTSSMPAVSNQNTTVNAPVTINGAQMQNLSAQELSAILGFELNKYIK